MNTQVDVAIIGGGPVGGALALALRGSRLKVRVLEARPASAGSQDARALALSYGSRLLLARLGVWDALGEISPIRTIHVSQRQSFGRTVLRAEELNVPELGYVLPYPALQDTLTDTLRSSDVASIYGASVTQIQGTADSATIAYQHDGKEQTLREIACRPGHGASARSRARSHSWGTSAAKQAVQTEARPVKDQNQYKHHHQRTGCTQKARQLAPCFRMELLGECSTHHADYRHCRKLHQAPQ